MNNLLHKRLSELYPSAHSTLSYSQVGGGSINDAYRVDYGDKRFFCKTNSAVQFPGLFQSERTGLDLLKSTHVVKVPEVIDCFESGDRQVLLLEWIQEGRRTKRFWETFGQALAALHQCRYTSFGLHENNYMGSVPQANLPTKDWNEFFEHRRLRPMVTLCGPLLESGHHQAFEKLYRSLPSIFDGGTNPVLIHGDLWSGNFMCDDNEQPVLIDPAVYYGHPSVDLGMSTLFGGFDPIFYASYQYYHPFPSHYKEQWQVCNLYPLLIHLYLFGESYLRQIIQILHRYDKMK